MNVGGQQIHQKRLHPRCFPVNSKNYFRAVILWKTYQWEHFAVILSKKFSTYARVNFFYIISIQQALKRNELKKTISSKNLLRTCSEIKT